MSADGVGAGALGIGEGGFVVLADGQIARVRPVTAADRDALVELHEAATPEDRYLRFFTTSPTAATQFVDRLIAQPPEQARALVATVGGGRAEHLIGIGSYSRVDGGDAEVALLVEHSHQGDGVGTLLLEHLAVAARADGVDRFVGETLMGNAAMLRVFGDVGFPIEHHLESGVVRVAFPLEPTEQALAAMDERERRADVRSIAHVLAPASVAVIGASRTPGSIGHELLRNIIDGGFAGPVYAVNAAGGTVCGRKAFRSMKAVPQAVDLAVIAVPAVAVPGVVAACGQRGVRAVCIVSAGFAELGEAGVAAEQDLVARAREDGMRVVGPNCLGLVSTDPAVRLDATFVAVRPLRGRLGFCSQSGTLGVSVLERTARMGLGVSGFVSVGNKPDVSGNDLLLFWEQDPRTEVIALYLESFGNPRKFARIARRVSRRKPIIAMKGRRSTPPQRGGLSDVAAAATPPRFVEALFAQTGVIRVDTTSELLDVAQLLVNQPLPAGNRLAVLGNSGGPGVLAADTAGAVGLLVPALSEPLRQRLAAVAPVAAVANPVDLGAAATPAQFGEALRLVLASGEVDAAVVTFASPLLADPAEMMAAVSREAADRPDLPVVAAILGAGDLPGTLPVAPGSRPVPVYPFPEQAVRALGHAAGYARWRDEPVGALPILTGIDVAAARARVGKALADEPAGGWLAAGDAAGLLADFGIPTAQAASGEVAQVVIGVVHDASFGPLVMLGMGGDTSELLGDRDFRILPLTDADAHRMVTGLRTAPLLLGFRGRPPADVAALEDMLLRVAALAQDLPELAELELSPVIVGTAGAFAAGARVRLAPPAEAVDPLLRRLR